MLLFLHLCVCCGAGPQLLGPLLSIAFLLCSGPLLTASLPSHAPDASVSDWLLSFPHTPDSREGTCSPGHTNTRAPDGPVESAQLLLLGCTPRQGPATLLHSLGVPSPTACGGPHSTAWRSPLLSLVGGSRSTAWGFPMHSLIGFCACAFLTWCGSSWVAIPS